MPTSKDTFLAHCKKEMQEYQQKGLLISYIHERKPRSKSSARPNAEEAKGIRRLLDAAPSLTPRGYLALLKIQGMDTKGKEEELTEKFLTARSFWLASRSPKVGCVVAFLDPQLGLMIGWSLCRVKSKGQRLDSFNKWIGVHEAIQSAQPCEPSIANETTVHRLIHQTETAMRVKHADKQPETPIPHTLLKHVKNMIVRGKKVLLKEETQTA